MRGACQVVALRILAVFCSLIILTPWAFAEEPLLLVTGEVPPYTSEKLEGYGFITEIVSLTLARMGIAPRYEFYPWRRCELMVKQGRAWAAFPFSHSKAREQNFDFSATIGSSRTVFFYHTRAPVDDLDTLESLRPHRVGGVLGYFYEELFREAGISIDFAADELQAFKKLAAGRVRLLPMNERVGWGLIRKHFAVTQNAFGVLATPLQVSELKLMVSRDYPRSRALLARFNAALKVVRTTPEYEEILERYGIDTP